jgi:hypothetical protein
MKLDYVEHAELVSEISESVVGRLAQRELITEIADEVEARVRKVLFKTIVDLMWIAVGVFLFIKASEWLSNQFGNAISTLIMGAIVVVVMAGKYFFSKLTRSAKV